MRKYLSLLFIFTLSYCSLSHAQTNTNRRDTIFKQHRTRPVWPYKGYIGFNPIYLSMGIQQTLILGGGVDGEFSLPRVLSIRASASRNYYEVDRHVWREVPWNNADKVKKGFMYDVGVSFHPIEWTDGGRYGYSRPTGGYKNEKVTVREYYTPTQYTSHTYTRSVPVTARYFSSDVFRKMICFRGGLLKYRYAQENGNPRYPSDFYVWDTYINAKYLGLSYYKVGLGEGYRVQYYADLVFKDKDGVEAPLRPERADSSITQTGFRAGFTKASGFGGGNYELGFVPGINKLQFYLKVTLTFNITVVNNNKGYFD
jgi:hypothetical protein